MVWRTQKRPSQEIIHASSQNTRWVANPSEPFMVSTKIATAPTTMSTAMAQYVHAHLRLLGLLDAVVLLQRDRDDDADDEDEHDRGRPTVSVVEEPLAVVRKLPIA